ncbi:MAG: ThuA domain-containing protein [Luteolibacter sp.]
MKHLSLYFCVLISLISTLPAKHVLFLTGEVTHGWGQHERPATSMLLAGLLQNIDPDITTEVILVDQDGWPTQAQIDQADCIFINSYGSKGHIINSEAKMSSLEAHMNQGKGVCVISFGISMNSAGLGERWKSMIGANWSKGGVALFFTEKLTAPKGEDHSILNGVVDHRLNDEIFFNYQRADASAGVLTPLLVHNAQGIDFPSNAGIRGNANAQAKKSDGFEFMMAWAFERADGGRSFCHGGGRYHFNLAKDSYRKSLINGIMWTLVEEIPNGGYNSHTPSAVTMLANIEKVNTTSWETPAGLADLQRALNYNQADEQAANWRNDAVKSGIRLTSLPNNVPHSYSAELPSPEFDLNDPRKPEAIPAKP